VSALSHITSTHTQHTPTHTGVLKYVGGGGHDAHVSLIVGEQCVLPYIRMSHVTYLNKSVSSDVQGGEDVQDALS